MFNYFSTNTIRPLSRRVHGASHPFHLVDVSPWPILMSFAALSGALALVRWLTLGINSTSLYILVTLNILVVFYLWLRDVVREGKAGYHTQPVQDGLMLGFVIFLITEVLLFASFFWAFLHLSLNPAIELAQWPPVGIESIGAWGLPLLNTVLLLGCGFTLTWAHHAFIKGNKDTSLFGLIITMVLIAIFLLVQFFEFSYGSYTISDSAYGSIFYSTTGLHGMHIIVALIMIGVSTFRIWTDQITSNHSLSLDTAIVYTHFTDVVWLAVFALFYYWGA
jgi:cytochrome c oxidase subunit 3